MAVVIGSGIVFLDGTVVNVALIAIGEQLPASLVGVLEGQSYIVNGYLLTLSALLILAGALADAFGRRRMLAVGLAGFGAASLACGLAPSMEILILGRLIQGCFGALLVPTSLAIITATFDQAERGRAIGIWAAATSALFVAGPAVGGILVDSVGWRMVFLINIPLVLVGVAIALRWVAESRDEGAGSRFDWLGAAVIAVAVGGLVYGAIRGQEQRWADLSAWVALALGVVAAVCVVPLMLWRRSPLIPPALFRSRNFTVTNLSTFLVYGALYVVLVYQAVYLQGTLGYTALAGGLATLPIGLGLVLLSTTFGRLAGRLGPRRFMAIGPAVMALGLLWYLRIPADSEPWLARADDLATLLPSAGYLVDVLPAILGMAIGMAVLVAPLTTALMSSVPVRNSGLASAINNAISRIGPLLAGAVIFMGITASFYGSLETRLPGIDTGSAQVREAYPPLNPISAAASTAQVQAATEAGTDAFRLAMLLSAILAGAGAAVNAVGIRNPESPTGG